MRRPPDRRRDQQHANRFIADRVDQGSVKAMAITSCMSSYERWIEHFGDAHARLLKSLRDQLGAAVGAHCRHWSNGADCPDASLLAYALCKLPRGSLQPESQQLWKDSQSGFVFTEAQARSDEWSHHDHSVDERGEPTSDRGDHEP